MEFAHRSAPHNVEGEGAGYGSGHVGTVSGLPSPAYRAPSPRPIDLLVLSITVSNESGHVDENMAAKVT